jgi:hypothetical protein
MKILNKLYEVNNEWREKQKNREVPWKCDQHGNCINKCPAFEPAFESNDKIFGTCWVKLDRGYKGPGITHAGGTCFPGKHDMFDFGEPMTWDQELFWEI